MSMRSAGFVTATLVLGVAWGATARAEGPAKGPTPPAGAAARAQKARPAAETKAAAEKPAAAKTPAGSATLSEGEKLSYALGMDLAAQFKRQSIALDPDVFVRGMKDVLAGGATLLTEQEVRTVITNLQMEMQAKRQAAIQAAGEKAKTEGDAFLAANKAKPGVVTLPSGLQYEVLKAGEGQKPTLESTVSCNYRGTFVNGTEFDASREAPVEFPVQGVIKGWTEALQLMPVGSKWRLVVPPDLAYGPTGRPGIPPNSTLVFEVELVAIKTATAPPAPAPAGTPGS